MALRDRFWPCEIIFDFAEIVFGLVRSVLAMPRSFLALRDRFWPCKMIFGLAEIVFGLARSFLALPRSFLALRDRFWPCEISINVPQLKSFIHGTADCFMSLFIFNCVFMRFNSLKSENVSRDKACIKSHRTS